VITNPDGVQDGIHASEAQQLIRITLNELESVIPSSDRLPAMERVSIYAGAYYTRLLECLGSFFPVFKRTVGADVFASFAAEYLHRYPSRSYTLDRLGDNFVHFLNETRPETNENSGWPDFLVDLATLEWAIACIFDGPGTEDSQLLTPESLQVLPAGKFTLARLKPVVCLRVFDFRYPVSAYYSEIRRAVEEQEVQVPDPAVEYVAILRRDFVVRRHPLTALEYDLLQAILAGATVGEAIRQSSTKTDLEDDALARVLQSSFYNWSAAGFFAGVQLGQT
jgi:hypothetical protein